MWIGFGVIPTNSSSAMNSKAYSGGIGGTRRNTFTHADASQGRVKVWRIGAGNRLVPFEIKLNRHSRGYAHAGVHEAWRCWGSKPKPAKISDPCFYRHFVHPSRDVVHVTGNVTELWSISVLILGVTQTTVYVTLTF